METYLEAIGFMGSYRRENSVTSRKYCGTNKITEGKKRCGM